jgi:homoserine dehydrogenase
MSDIVGNVMQAYNVVEITSDYVENVLFYGKGAGRYVTASAVVSDIMKTHNKELWTHDYTYTDAITPIEDSRFYVRSSQPLDIDYEESYSMDDQYIYITTKQNLNALKLQLSGVKYTLLKVRDEK